MLTSQAVKNKFNIRLLIPIIYFTYIANLVFLLGHGNCFGNSKITIVNQRFMQQRVSNMKEERESKVNTVELDGIIGVSWVHNIDSALLHLYRDQRDKRLVGFSCLYEVQHHIEL